jgi:hypothetical protein
VILSAEIRNAQADLLLSMIGPSPFIEFRTDVVPADTLYPDVGDVLASGVLPADWLSTPAVDGLVEKQGIWQFTVAVAGNVSHFRIRDNALTKVWMQGSVTAVGGGGVMQVENTGLQELQYLRVVEFAYRRV